MSAAAILSYHRVASLSRDPFGLAIPPELFAAQVRVIAERYLPVELAAVSETERGVAVTFDDGYPDTLDAARVLADARVPATFFIPSGLLGQVPWWERLTEAFEGDVLAREHTRLLHRSWEEQAAAVAPLPPAAGARLLDEAGVRALAAIPGVTIGAHGAHHLWLPAQDEAIRRHEMEADRRQLEALLGRGVDRFAYPFGAADESTAAQVAAAGFRLAVTTRQASAFGAPPLLLPRLAPPALAGDAFADWLDRALAAGPLSDAQGGLR